MPPICRVFKMATCCLDAQTIYGVTTLASRIEIRSRDWKGSTPSIAVALNLLFWHNVTIQPVTGCSVSNRLSENNIVSGVGGWRPVPLPSVHP